MIQCSNINYASGAAASFVLVRVSLLECIIAVRCCFEAMLQVYHFTCSQAKSAGVSLIS